MVKITFAGDISLANMKGIEWDSTLTSLFQNSDCVVANLEAPLTHLRKKKKIKSYYLRANPVMVESLSSISAMSIANKHIMDYGREGMIETINVLNANGIEYFGAGCSPKDSYKPFIYEKDDIKVAVFGATHYFRSKFYRPTGTADLFSNKLIKAIEKFKKIGYFVVVYPHWGYEYIPYPSPRERRVARKLINAGADLIIGSHPHEIQAMEVIDGKYVYYSLGNFVFSSKDFAISDKKLFQSLVVRVYIGNDNSYSIVTSICEFSDDRIRMVSKSDEGLMLAYLNDISQAFKLETYDYNYLFYKEFSRLYNIRRSRANTLNSCSSDTVSSPKHSIFQKVKGLIIMLGWIDLQTLKIFAYLRLKILRELILKLN